MINPKPQATFIDPVKTPSKVVGSKRKPRANTDSYVIKDLLKKPFVPKKGRGQRKNRRDKQGRAKTTLIRRFRSHDMAATELEHLLAHPYLLRSY